MRGLISFELLGFILGCAASQSPQVPGGLAQAGDCVCIQEEFAANSPYALIFEVREDDFDPAQADPMLPKEPG